MQVIKQYVVNKSMMAFCNLSTLYACKSIEYSTIYCAHRFVKMELLFAPLALLDDCMAQVLENRHQLLFLNGKRVEINLLGKELEGFKID